MINRRWTGMLALLGCTACASDGILAPETEPDVEPEAAAAPAMATPKEPTPTIRLRCFSSLEPRPEPVYVLDGVIVEALPPSLRAEDIVSIEVLHDATSASIYGARTERGVVTITTRNAPVRATS